MLDENYYKVGGILEYQHPTYVVRQADFDLYDGLKNGEFCYVLNSRQMGKSSLRVQMMKKLKEQGVKCASIDMTRIGSHVTPQEWYAGVVSELLRGFSLSRKVNFSTWWRDRELLPPLQRLSQFIDEVILTKLKQNIVIFFDEIDSIIRIKFKDDFFSFIRSCYNHRADNPEYKRLTFCLLGVAKPSDLIQDKQRTPFNIGRAIELTGFNLEEAQSALTKGLSVLPANPKIILEEVLSWTGGQPFLTQKLCQLIIQELGVVRASGNTPIQKLGELIENPKSIAQFVQQHVIDNWEAQDEPEHLRTIRDRLLRNEQRTGRLLGLYQQILQQKEIAANDTPEQMELRLSGLVVKQDGKLKVYNRIYESIFDQSWIDRQLDNLRPYSQSIAIWLASNSQDESRLLRGQALQEALDWKAGKSLSVEDDDFLAASQQLAWKEKQAYLEAERTKEVEARLVQEKKSARRQKHFLAAVSTALVVSTLLAVAVFFQYRKAALSELEAIVKSSEALFASNQKLDALIEAIRATRQLQKLGLKDADIHIQVVKVLQQAVDGVKEYNRLSGHSDAVWGVAFSPDGQTIVSVSRDNTIKLWNTDGTLLNTLRGHSGTVVGVAFSPDGQMIASGSWDKTVKLWNREGTLLTTLRGHGVSVIGVAFSPDGQIIASASGDKTLKLWNREGTLLTTLRGHQDAVIGVAFSPDGQIIASASDDKTVKLWNRNGTLLTTLKGHRDEVFGVAFSPDGQIIASASDDKTVKLWKRNGTLLNTLTGHSDEVYKIAFSPDGKTLASGSRDKTLKLWKRDGTLLTTLSGHSGEVWGVAFSPDGKTLASASNDGTVKLWKIDSPWLKTLNGHDATVRGVAFSPDGKILASAGGDNTIKLWNRDGTLLNTLSGHSGEVRGVSISPDGKTIASASWDKTIKLWKINGTLVATLKSHSTGIWKVAFSANAEMIASASDDSTVKLWKRDGTLVTTLNGHSAGVNDVAFSPDGQIIASASNDSTIKLWKRDGTLLATLRGHSATVRGLAFSPNGNAVSEAMPGGLIASVSGDNTIKLWKRDGTLLTTLRGHSAGVNGVAFSPNGQMIASASDDNTVKLWKRDGSLLTTFSGHSSGVNGVSFSPDGKTLASASVDNTVILWNLDRDLDLDVLLKYGCDWARVYLKHNSEVDKRDRHLCDGLGNGE